MHGRVGDSPIIGSGLFVDNEIGSAAATGLGEEVIKTNGSFLVVELMRQGRSPKDACEEALKELSKDIMEIQTSNWIHSSTKDGEVGAACLKWYFDYALSKNGVNKIYNVNGMLR